MSESETARRTERGIDFSGDLAATRRLLRVVYAIVPIAAGLDKFTNVLTAWADYLPATLVDLLPVAPTTFMYVVGVIEILAGLSLLTRYAEYGADVIAAWLLGVAGVLAAGGFYDVAVRDVVIAVGAVALAQLLAARDVS